MPSTAASRTASVMASSNTVEKYVRFPSRQALRMFMVVHGAEIDPLVRGVNARLTILDVSTTLQIVSTGSDVLGVVKALQD